MGHFATFHECDHLINWFGLDIVHAKGFSSNVHVTYTSQQYIANGLIGIVSLHGITTCAFGGGSKSTSYNFALHSGGESSELLVIALH